MHSRIYTYFYFLLSVKPKCAEHKTGTGIKDLLSQLGYFIIIIGFRGWIVNPGNVTYWWLIIVSIIPAILATILVFLDQQITAVIINRKEHKLKAGYLLSS